MYNSDTELLFPTRIISTLGAMRSQEWQQMIAELCTDPAEKIDHLAFVLMMVKLGGCLGCNADSYAPCAAVHSAQSKPSVDIGGSDKELIELFNQSRREMQTYLKKHIPVGKN